MQKAIRTGQMVSWSVIFYTIASLLTQKESPYRSVYGDSSFIISCINKQRLDRPS